MTSRDVQTRITEEIQEVHAFFERWFRGELPATREVFDRVERALGSGFRMITPGGELVEREPLMESLWNAHASTHDRFEIEVRNVREPLALDNISHGVIDSEARELPDAPGSTHSWFVLYEEWQWRGTERTARLSSAWLDETGEGTWIWRNVHETWMPRVSASG